MTKTYSFPRVKIGDIVMFHCDKGEPMVLIIWEVPDNKKDDDQFWYGGVMVGNFDYHEPAWINVLDWAINPGNYEIVGHINLNKAAKP